MFFLGGLNTILPHLLYLAVLSVFLIIGLCGRSNFSRDGITILKTSHIATISDYQNEPDLNSFPVTIPDAEQHIKNHLSLAIRVEHIHFDYFRKPEFSAPPTNHYYRGPPRSIKN